MKNFTTRQIIIISAFILIALFLLIRSNGYFKGSFTITDPKHETNTTRTMRNINGGNNII